MSLPIRFHPLAEDDLVDAWSWYEAKQGGLGDRFIASVRAALEMVARWPNSGTPAVEGPDDKITERRVTTSGFPYAIRYRTIDEVVVVIVRPPDLSVPGTRRTGPTRHTSLLLVAFMSRKEGGDRR